MEVKSAAQNVLNQLNVVLEQINQDDYNVHIDSLGASIGQHVRHILEFYLRLIKGLKTGIVNYDLRDRDLRIETDLTFAKEKIQIITDKINIDPVLDLKLEMNYGDQEDHNIVMSTNFQRELAYNIEHTIHHMAIIKHALKEKCSYVKLPAGFGIASSTIRHKNGN